MQSGHGRLLRDELTELQINVGFLCNQACEHCHVEAGPKRTEIMTRETADQILTWARANNIKSVDITGGAPEMCPEFRYMVDEFLDMGAHVISRCNITVLYEPAGVGLAQWYADRKVHLICSMPCYTKENVDAQRGKGVFDKSIQGLIDLNAVGYGVQDDLQLDLVYNPGGAFLPPSQESLETDYRQRLLDDFGIRFTNLLALANLPVKRFEHFLERTGQLEDYQDLLEENFNATTVPGLMCKRTVSVDWQGRIYDCDFNQMLEMPAGGHRERYLWDIEAAQMKDEPIATDKHCFGCTAGAGSSCGGALA